MTVPKGRIERILHLVEWQDELSLRHEIDHRDPLSPHFRIVIPLETGNVAEQVGR